MGTFFHRMFVSLIVCVCLIITRAQILSALNNREKTERSEIQVRRNANIMALAERVITYSTYYHVDEDGTESTTNLKSWRSQDLPNFYRYRWLRTGHGILNMIGWGTLLPMGVIIARYLRKYPMHWNGWYSCHIICQTAGYFLGTIGWFLGLLASHSHTHDIPYRILGILIFIFTTIQMLAIVWQPKKEDDEVYGCCRKSWEIYHHLLGYALIALIIADVFQGLKHQNQPHKWRWTYAGIVALLGLTAVSFEMFKWVKSKMNTDIYTSP